MDQHHTETLINAHTALSMACIGACSCLTKTPEVKYHTENCMYRIYSEAIDGLEEILHASLPSPESAKRIKAQVKNV